MNYNSANNEAYEMNLNNIYQNPYNKNEQYEQSYTIEELKKIIYEEDKMNKIFNISHQIIITIIIILKNL